MKIAFIGLGNMGGGMAANLVKAGHEVRAFDLSESRASRGARGRVAPPSPRPREACEGVEAVVSMLPNGAIVKSVYGTSVIGHAPEGAIMLDCSTIDVATAREVIAVTEAQNYADGRCAGLGRDRGGQRRHADLHGRRLGRGLRARRSRSSPQWARR